MPSVAKMVSKKIAAGAIPASASEAMAASTPAAASAASASASGTWMVRTRGSLPSGTSKAVDSEATTAEFPW